jgi:hypothetical protein
LAVIIAIEVDKMLSIVVVENQTIGTHTEERGGEKIFYTKFNLEITILSIIIVICSVVVVVVVVDHLLSSV